MTQIPPDAQRSPDGHYWWDGEAWQLIDQAQAADPAAAGGDGAQQETEPRQVTISAAGVAGDEAQLA
jgi:hypothetical protein